MPGPSIADVDFRLGARNDNGGDPFNGALLRLIIWPRRLLDSELIPFDPRPVPAISFATYAAIETEGGAGGAEAEGGVLEVALTGAESRDEVLHVLLMGVDGKNKSLDFV